MKYKPVTSQLFINTIIDGTEHIVDVQDIWTWNCEGNPEQFEENVKEIISKSLRGEI